jgi:hypothetical protein
MNSNKNNKNKNKNIKKIKNQNKKKAGNRRRNQGRSVAVRPNKFVSRGTAPSAVSDDLQQFVRFKQGTDESSLRVHMCVPLFFINSNYYTASLVRGGLSLTPTDSFPYVMLNNITGSYAGGGADTARAYINRVMGDVGSAFVRYSVDMLKFFYEPQSPTSVADRLVFAFAADPEHPNIKSSPAAATQSKLLSLSESVAFAPWRAWELDVTSTLKLARKDLLYTFNQDNSELDNRFTFFGSIGCVPSVEPTAATAMTVYGVLYAEIILNLYELDPVNTADPTLLTPSDRLYKRFIKAGWSKKCNDLDCKACSKKCIMTCKNYTDNSSKISEVVHKS